MHTKFERRCVSCRQTNNKYQMLRVVRINNVFVLDKNHKLNGRGAYVCNNKDCVALCIKKRLLNRAYRTNIGEEIYLKLGEYEQNN